MTFCALSSAKGMDIKMKNLGTAGYKLLTPGPLTTTDSKRGDVV